MKKTIELFAIVVLSVGGMFTGIFLAGILPAEAQMPANLNAFSQHWARVQPHDTNNLTRQPRAIMLDEDGQVAMIGWGDSSSTCVVMELYGGQIYPLSPRRICDTNTDAMSVIVLY